MIDEDEVMDGKGEFGAEMEEFHLGYKVKSSPVSTDDLAYKVQSSPISLDQDDSSSVADDSSLSSSLLLNNSFDYNSGQRVDFEQEIIERLWTAKELGTESPKAILLALWFFFSRYFGIGSRTDHARLCFGNVVLKETEDNKKWLEFVRIDSHPVSPRFPPKKLEAIPDGKDQTRCPVRIFEALVEHRPQSTRYLNQPLYLQPDKEYRTRPDSIWFTTSGLGKNKIGGMLNGSLKRVGLPAMRHISLNKFYDHGFPLRPTPTKSLSSTPMKKVTKSTNNALKLKITKISTGKPVVVDATYPTMVPMKSASALNGDLKALFPIASAFPMNGEAKSPAFRRILPKTSQPLPPVIAEVRSLAPKPVAKPVESKMELVEVDTTIIKPEEVQDASECTKTMELAETLELKDEKEPTEAITEAPPSPKKSSRRNTTEEPVEAPIMHRYNTRRMSRSQSGLPPAPAIVDRRVTAKRTRNVSRRSSRSPVKQRKIEEKTSKDEAKDVPEPVEVPEKVETKEPKPVPEEVPEVLEIADDNHSKVDDILNSISEATDSVAHSVAKAAQGFTISGYTGNYRILTSLLQNSVAAKNRQGENIIILAPDRSTESVTMTTDNAVTLATNDGDSAPPQIDLTEDDNSIPDGPLEIVTNLPPVLESISLDDTGTTNEGDMDTAEYRIPKPTSSEIDNLRIELRKSANSPGRSVKLELKAILELVSGSGETGNKGSQLVTDLLYQSGALGDRGPWLLIFTMWWMIQHYVGVGSRMNHVKLRWGHFRLIIEKDSSGVERECIEFVGPSCFVTSKTAELCKRIYSHTAQPNGRLGPDFVNLYKVYASRRLPSCLAPESNFYLQPLQGSAIVRKQQVWFGESPLGKNRIGALMRNIVEKVVRPNLHKVTGPAIDSLRLKALTNPTPAAPLQQRPTQAAKKMIAPPMLKPSTASHSHLGTMQRNGASFTIATSNAGTLTSSSNPTPIIQLVQVSPNTVVLATSMNKSTPIQAAPMLTSASGSGKGALALKAVMKAKNANKMKSPRGSALSSPFLKPLSWTTPVPEPQPGQLKTLNDIVQESLSFQAPEFPEYVAALWSRGVLGTCSPWSLNFSTWFINTLVFGVESRNEHLRLCWGDFREGKAPDGRDFLYFVNSVTGETHYLVANEEGSEDQCPMRIYHSMRDRRPSTACEPFARFYLQPRSVVQLKGSIPWFTEQGWGKNKLGGLMADAAQMAGLPLSWLRKRRARNYFPVSSKSLGLSMVPQNRSSQLQPLTCDGSDSEEALPPLTAAPPAASQLYLVRKIVVKKPGEDGSLAHELPCLLPASLLGQSGQNGILWLVTNNNGVQNIVMANNNQTPNSGADEAMQLEEGTATITLEDIERDQVPANDPDDLALTLCGEEDPWGDEHLELQEDIAMDQSEQPSVLSADQSEQLEFGDLEIDLEQTRTSTPEENSEGAGGRNRKRKNYTPKKVNN